MFRLLSTCRLILWMRLWNRKWYWSRGAPRKPKFWSWLANLLKQITCFLSCKNQNCGANLVYKVVISEPLNFPRGYLTWVLSNIDNTNFYMTHTMLQFVYLSIFVIYLDLYIGLALILYEKEGPSSIFVGEEKTNGSIWRKRSLVWAHHFLFARWRKGNRKETKLC